MSDPNNPLSGSLPTGYRLLQCLGRGAAGEVWRAEAPGGVEVAIKLIRRALKSEEAARELQALELIKKLRHPFLLSLQSFHALEDRIVIVLELADRSLRQRLEECRQAGQPGIPSGELVRYTREAAEALDYLHAHGVLHRDVKPDNLLLLGRHIMVADCGVACLLERTDPLALSMAGTPPYMAAEAWEGLAREQSDQYGLAVSYVELRQDRLPLRPQQYMPHLLGGPRGDPDLDFLGEREQVVLRRALAPSPTERFPTCLEFARTLARAVFEDTAHGSGRKSSDSQFGMSSSLFPLPAPVPAPGPKLPLAEPELSFQATAFLPPSSPPGAPPTPPLPEPPPSISPTAFLPSDRPAASTGPMPPPLESVPTPLLPPPLEVLSEPPSVLPVFDFPDLPTSWPEDPSDSGAGILLPEVASVLEADQPEDEDDARLTLVPEGGSVTPEAPVPPPPRPVPVDDEVIQTAAIPAPAEQPKPRPGPFRNSRVAVLAVCLLVAVVGFTVWQIVSLLGSPETSPPDKGPVASTPSDAPKPDDGQAIKSPVQPIQKPPLPTKQPPRVLRLQVRDVTLKAGERGEVEVRVRRENCSGPVAVRMEGLPKGVRVEPETVAADGSVARLQLRAEEDAPDFDGKATVLADLEGVPARQTIHLTVTGLPLRLQALDSVTLQPGQTRAVWVCVQRPRGAGTIDVEPGQLPKGVTAWPCHIQPDADRAILVLRAASGTPLGKATVQLTAKRGAARAVDECRLTIIEPRVFFVQQGEDMAAVRQNPMDPVALLNLAHTCQGLGEADLARTYCTQALKADRNCVPAYVSRAEAYLLKKNPPRAIEDCDAALRLDVRHGYAYVVRARAHAALPDVGKAIADYDEAIRLSPSDAVLRHERGRLHAAQDDRERAFADCKEAIRLDPKFFAAYRDCATICLTQQLPDKAIAEYTAAIQNNASPALAYTARGDIHFLKKDYDRAIDDYKLAEKADRAARPSPNRPLAYYERGLLRFAQNQYAAAIADYTAAVGFKSDFAQAYYKRGNVYLAQNNYQKALADYQTALDHDKKHAYAYHGRGDVYYEQRDYLRAITEYNQAVKLSPAEPHHRNNRGNAHAALGYLYAERKDPRAAAEYELALADYKEAIALDRNCARPLLNRGGRVYLRQRRYAEAIDDLTLAIDIKGACALDRKDRAQAFADRCWAYHLSNRPEQASADCAAALQLNPSLSTYLPTLVQLRPGR